MLFQGVETVPIISDEEGILAEAIDEAGLRGVYVSPSSQFPLSVTMSERRRTALLELSRKNGLWILEEDSPNLAWYGSQALGPLRSHPEAAGRVINMESFSLMLFPAVQTGYLLVPSALREHFIGAKLLFDRFKSESNQALVAHYMMSDEFQRHCRKIRARYQKAHAFFVEAAEASIGRYGRFMPTRCGPHMTFILKDGIDDVRISQKMSAAGYTLRALSSYDFSSGQKGFVFGFAGFSEDVVRRGLEALASIIAEGLESS